MLEPDPLLIFVTFGRAVTSGVIFLTGSIYGIRRSDTFRRRWYWWVLGFSFAVALLGPFFYVWMTPYVTIQDAILLRAPLRAGSWHVAEGYSILVGTAAGGLIGFGLVRRSKVSERHEELGKR